MRYRVTIAQNVPEYKAVIVEAGSPEEAEELVEMGLEDYADNDESEFTADHDLAYELRLVEGSAEKVD